MKEYIIYGRTKCSYCDKVYNFMREKNEKFIYVIMNNLENNLAEIKNLYDWHTVPIVVELTEYEGEKIAKLIGGFEDTMKYFEEKK